MLQKSYLFLLLLVTVFSLNSIYSINVCGVNVDENNGFYVLDSSGNYVLAIDRQGDTFIQGSSGVSGGGSGVFEIAGTSFSFSSTDVSYSDSSQSMGSVPNSGFLVESSLGRVSQIDSSGNLRTQGLIAGEGSQGACNSDGWLYCSGGTRENRDYFCNVNGIESGVCTYSVDGSENCLTKSSVDSDGNSFNLGGFVRDYTGCNTGSCTFNDYGDYCSSTNIVVDYRDSGSGVSSSSYNCNGNNYYYCSGLTRRYVDYNCGAGSGGCVENSDTAVETCSAPPTSYGTWSCSDNFTAVRSMTTYSPSCSASGCGISSFTGTDTDSCGGGNICRPSSGCGTPSDCSLEGDGTFVAHGDSITAYDSTIVPYGDSCNSQVRECYDGTLSGSSSYGYGSCSVGPAQSCDLPWGGSVAHGSSVDAYSSSSVSYGNSCNDVKQTRTCTNGVLSGSYTNENCVVGNPSSCTLDGITKNHGESHTFYLSSSPTYPTLCEGISRTCDDGSFDGSNSYGESSCTDPTPSSCSLPWVGSVNHGDSVTAYQSSSVPYGNSCTSQTRTCNDGTLSGSYTNQNCEIEEATGAQCVQYVGVTPYYIDDGESTSQLCGCAISSVDTTNCGLMWGVCDDGTIDWSGVCIK